MRSKIPELTEALTGRFGAHQAFLARLHLDLIDQHTAAIDGLTARIEVMIEPFAVPGTSSSPSPGSPPVSPT